MLSPLIEIDFLEANDFAKSDHVYEYLSNEEYSKVTNFINLLKNVSSDGIYQGWNKLDENSHDTVADAFRFLTNKNIFDNKVNFGWRVRLTQSLEADFENARNHIATFSYFNNRRYALLGNIVPIPPQGIITSLEARMASLEFTPDDSFYKQHAHEVNYYFNVIELDIE